MSEVIVFVNNNSLTLTDAEVGGIAFILGTVLDEPQLAEKLMDAWIGNTTLELEDREEVYAILMAYGILKSGAKVEEVTS